MDLKNFNFFKNLSNQIKEKTVDIQHQISQTSSYVDPSYQRLMKEAFAIQREWKQAIKSYFICALGVSVIGLCIIGLMGKLGIFIAVLLTMPLIIQFGWHGLRLLLHNAIR